MSSPPSTVRAIVAGHATFAAGLVSAVDAITGRGGVFRAVSGAGLAAADVAALLASALDETGAMVVFTDLPGGSATLAARRMQRERAGLTVVIGVNLPTLLEFAMREGAAKDDVAAAVDRGRENIRIVDTPSNVG